MTSAVAKTGKKTILGGLRLAAKKAATFKADVSVDGAKQKVNSTLLLTKQMFFSGSIADPTRRLAQVGNKIDRFLYQSKAKDDETPQSELRTCDNCLARFNNFDRRRMALHFAHELTSTTPFLPPAYPAKLDGTSGHLVITVGPQSPPTLSFVPLRSIDNKPTFHEPINDLVEIKKRGVSGTYRLELTCRLTMASLTSLQVFIARAVLGWAASINLEGMGLEMRFKEHHERLADGIGQGDVPHEETHQGQLWSFSHVARRDQLFARLLSVGTQQWETL